MTTLRLLPSSSLESPDDRRRRSLLYKLAFCALALAVEYGSAADPSPDAGRQAYFVLLCVLALLTGFMALCVRRCEQDTSYAVPEVSRASTGKIEGGLSGLGAWRRGRANKFSEFSDRLPALPSDSPAMSTAKVAAVKTAASQPEKAEIRKFDPWAKALEEFSNRKNERGSK